MDPAELDELRRASAPRLARLREAIASCRSALVAFSAGVDSTLVVAVAREVLGDRTVALTAHSPAVPAAEREEARTLAASLGVRHLEVESREQDDPRYVANGTDRCYHCKSELYRLCEEVARREGLEAILDGFNADDRGDHRPGHRAAGERGVRSPLAEAGLSKLEVRAWSAAYGLPTWEKPQMACLASRIPYGTPVTPERLAQVEKAEAALRALGLRDLRVRHHGDIGRIEVSEAEIERAFARRQELVAAVKSAGFRLAALDLEPFRSGRMNTLAGISLPVVPSFSWAPPAAGANLLAGLLLAGLLAPAAAAGLERRYDHRDESGLVVEPLVAHDTVAIAGRATRSAWRPALRLAYDWDPLGDGNELFLGVQGALDSWHDPAREKIRLAIDARYRAYFGTDEWKTYFEVGLWAPLSSRLAVGPLASLGAAYDFSRSTGLYGQLGFATGLGAARIATFTISAGAQVRF